MLPKVYIATLTSNNERVLYVRDTLVPSLRDFPCVCLHEAIDGKTDAQTLSTLKIDERFASKCRVGQLGCYATHCEIWRRAIAEGQESCIVLEDDAEFKTNANHIAQVLQEAKDYDFVYLFTSDKQYRNDEGVHVSGCTQINKSYRQYGTVAYYVTKKGMEILLRELERITNTIDISIAQLARYRIKAASCKVVPFGTVGQVYGHYKNERFRSTVHNTPQLVQQAK